MMPPSSGEIEEPSACAPKRTPMLVPPMFFGVVSRSHACSTGRIAYRKKPRTATKNTNASDLPATAMKTSTTAVIAMLVIMTLLRPMRSDRWPATGEAAKPAACSANMQRAEKDEDEERDHNAGDDVQYPHLSPREHREQRAHDDRRDGVADVAAHAVQRK